MQRPLLTIIMPFICLNERLRARLSIEATDAVEILSIDDGGLVSSGVPGPLVSLPWNTLSACGVSTPGGIPRAVGTVISRGIWTTYLDQDNRHTPGYVPALLKHLASLDDDVLYTWCKRNWCLPWLNAPLGVDTIESNDVGMLDTNTMIIRTDAFRAYSSMWAAATPYGDDRAVFKTLQDLKAGYQMRSVPFDFVGIDYFVNRRNWKMFCNYFKLEIPPEYNE